MAGTPQRLYPIDSGLNLNVNPFRLTPGETPDSLNVDFDQGSVRASGGAIKFNNRVAPRPGVRTRPNRDARLPVLYEKSAPVVGHVVLPWKKDQDIGGDFAEATHSSETGTLTKTVYPARRGKSFGMKVSFRLPESEQLFSAPTLPTNDDVYTSTSALRTYTGADIALDDFTAIAQKGGDGMTPMSWALGIVNTGELLDVNVGSGNNVLGTATSTHQNRPSNYMLCFMWLDAPGYGAWRPSGMRYYLSDGTISDATNGSGTGEHCTLAYRAMVAPLFVEPGRDYHVEMQLSIDTGTPGANGDSTPTTDWEGDGTIKFICKTDDEAVQTYSWANSGTNTIYRWKGPSDSLEYFSKYGVRWSGKEEMHLGLGYRCAPWTAGGFLYAGIDSAPLENHGFRISDPSQVPVSTYDDYAKPDQAPNSVSNTKTVLHQLRCNHKADEANVEINHRGMSTFSSGLATEWGSETGLWSGVHVASRHPWGVHNKAWQGLDGDATGGVNTQALRGYRLVFTRDGAGVDSRDAAGYMLTINTMENTAAYTGNHYSYRMTPETGLGFVDNSVSFGAHSDYTYNANFNVTVRAFRWNQRATDISDFRIYDSPRSYTDKKAEWSLWHETKLNDTQEPGVADLVGAWPLSDGEGAVCRDIVAGNHGVFAPFSLPAVDAGQEGKKQLFLSGEGERLQLDFSESPTLKELLRQSLQDGKSGFAVQMRFRTTGAIYGQSRKIAGPANGASGTTDNLWESKFAPNLIDWAVKDVDSVDPSSGTDYFDHGQYSQLRSLLQFGHRIHAEYRIGDSSAATGGSEAWRHPMPFDLKVPNDSDESGAGLFVANPQEVGTGANGYAWYQNSNVNYNRYHSSADWVNRTVTVQVGVQPSSTAETVKVYVAWSPSEALVSTSQASDGEMAFYEEVTFARRDLERSVITIGGGSYPNEMAWCEMGAKIFVDAVRVFGAAAPGELPSASGSVVSTGTGKISGGRAYPDRELFADDMLRPVGGTASAVKVASGSSTVTASGNADFSTVRPEVDIDAVIGSYLRVQNESLTVPTLDDMPESYTKAYFVSGATSTTLTLARPYEGDSKSGVSAHSFRILGYSSFSDDISDKPLPLGRGEPLSYAATSSSDAVQTAVYFKNPAPGEIGWRLTLLSPLAVGRATDISPQWCRGLVSSRDNRILGMKSMEDVLYVAAQGSLFEADDRWRPYGPTGSVDRSIHFRARRDDRTGLSIPMQGDRVEFDNASVITNPASGRQLIIDAWVQLDEYAPIQTIAWCGRTDSDPSKNASSTGHKVAWWFRLRDGHPELMVGSSGNTGSSPPERGLFSAKSDAKVALEEWTHVRVLVERNAANYAEPVFWINGNIVPTVIRQREDTVSSPNWIIATNALAPDSNYKLVLGCARDARSVPFKSPTDNEVLPDLFQGWLHSLSGRLSGFAISSQTDNAHFSSTSNFDPRGLNHRSTTTGYSSLVRVLADGGETAAGHLVEDTAQDRYGRIHSHPFISLWHQLGPSEGPVSFAAYNREIFVANGGRVVIIEDGAVRNAGLVAPNSLPDFSLDGDPLYKPNSFNASGDVNNDAVEQLDTSEETVTDLRYHLSVPGSTYIRQLGDPNMDWGLNKYFAWSALLRMDSVDGRIPLYSRRNSLKAGGPFVECRDGYLYIGWWDTTLKKEVYVRTSKPVLEPGFDTYIHVRKFYPRTGVQAGAGEKWFGGLNLAQNSNWTNSQWDADRSSGGKLIARDLCIVRRVPKEDLSTNNYDRWTGFDAKAAINYPGAATSWHTADSSDRPVSFVLAETDISNAGTSSQKLGSNEDYTLTGPVLVDTAEFDSGDTDTIDIDGTAATFVLDHTGMLCQIAKRTSGTASTNYDGGVFRIQEVLSKTKIRVIKPDGTAPTFVSGDFPTSIKLIVAPDVSLVASEDFHNSQHPDEATYPIEMFGSQLQANPLNGITPFQGVVYSLKYGMFETSEKDGDDNLMEEPDIFVDADAANDTSTTDDGKYLQSGSEIGVDYFVRTSAYTPTSIASLPFAGKGLTGLRSDDGKANTAVFCLGTTWAATYPDTPQPNKDRKIVTTDAKSTNKNPLYFATPEGIEVAQGLRRIRTRFIDPANRAASAPSEELRVFAVEEDKEQPSDNLRLKLTNLPVSSDPQKTMLQIYMTVPDGGEYFLAGEVDSSSDSFTFKVDDLALSQMDTVLDFTEGAPPRAHVVGVAQGSMWYGDITTGGVRQEDAVAFSVPYRPEVVAPDQIAPVDTGDRVGIVGISEYAGQAVIFKRNSIFTANIVSAGGQLGLSTRQVSSNDGAVSAQCIEPFEGRLYFVSDRGPMVLFSLTEEPVYIGRRIGPYFRDSMEPRFLSSISACINRHRDQYVFTAEDRADGYAADRFSVEFDHPEEGDAAVNAVIAGHRFSKYSGPRVTALGSVVSKDGGSHVMVGGTAEGFLVWMDRGDVRTVMMGPTSAVWGATTLTAGASNVFSGTVDNVFEGPRGAPLRWLDTSSNEQGGYIDYWYVDNNSDLRVLLYGQDAAVTPTATANSTVTVGALLARWSTSVLHYDRPEVEKEWLWFDLARSPKASGQLEFEAYRDLAAAPESGQSTLDMTKSFSSEDLSSKVKETRALRLLVKTVTPSVDVDFELLDVTVRATPTDNR